MVIAVNNMVATMYCCRAVDSIWLLPSGGVIFVVNVEDSAISVHSGFPIWRQSFSIFQLYWVSASFRQIRQSRNSNRWLMANSTVVMIVVVIVAVVVVWLLLVVLSCWWFLRLWLPLFLPLVLLRWL